MPAQASCWGEREVAAAQVREMQTMLMVAALRCRAAHIDISADYDGFVVAQKDSIDHANMVIKTHFAQAGGQQSDYDHFATSLANGFGDDETTEATCAEAAILAHDGSAAMPAALEGLALARVFPAKLPGGSCAAPAAPVTMAAATPAKAEKTNKADKADAPVALASASVAKPAALPPLINLQAPTPVAEAVSLPSDVVAAMTVLARFQAQHAPTAASAPTQVASVQH